MLPHSEINDARRSFVGNRPSEGAHGDDVLVDSHSEVLLSNIEARLADAAGARLNAIPRPPLGRTVIGLAEPVRRHLKLDSPMLYEPLSSIAHEAMRDRFSTGKNYVLIDVTYRLSRTYPEIGEPISIETAASAVDAIYPSIVFIQEVDGRLQQPIRRLCGTLKEASNLKMKVDLHKDIYVDVSLMETSKTLWEGTSTMNNPLRGLVWAAEDLERQSKTFMPRDLIGSGTCPLLLPLAAHQCLRATFPSLQYSTSEVIGSRASGCAQAATVHAI